MPRDSALLTLTDTAPSASGHRLYLLDVELLIDRDRNFQERLGILDMFMAQDLIHQASMTLLVCTHTPMMLTTGSFTQHLSDISSFYAGCSWNPSHEERCVALMEHAQSYLGKVGRDESGTLARLVGILLRVWQQAPTLTRSSRMADDTVRHLDAYQLGDTARLLAYRDLCRALSNRFFRVAGHENSGQGPHYACLIPEHAELIETFWRDYAAAG